MIDCSRWQARNPPSNVSGALFHYAHKKIVSLCAHACVMYARGEMAHKPWNCNHASVCLSSRPPLPVVSAETAAIPPGPQKYTHYICTLLSTWSSRGQLGGAAYRIKFAFSLSLSQLILSLGRRCNYSGVCRRTAVSVYWFWRQKRFECAKRGKFQLSWPQKCKLCLAEAHLHYHFCTTDLHSALCVAFCLFSQVAMLKSLTEVHQAK